MQMLDFAENTLKAHLEKEYILKEETTAYQMEYFDSGDEKGNDNNYEENKGINVENKETGNETEKQNEAASTLEHLKLLEEFIEQL